MDCVTVITLLKCQYARVNVCCRLSILLFVHSCFAPSLAVNGGSGRQNRRFRITPTVVRRGQTDWLRRLLCGNLGGFAGLGYYSPAPHSSRASRLPTVSTAFPQRAVCQLNGWVCCCPAETVSWSVC